MSGKSRGDYSESGNTKATDTSLKNCIIKLIEDIERDIQRIESKIATICGHEDTSTRREMEGKNTADKECGLKESVGEAATSQAKPEGADDKIACADVALSGEGKGRLLQKMTSSQKSDAELDEYDWDAFVAERTTISIGKANTDEVKAACSDDVDDEWEGFLSERVAMAQAVPVGDDSDDSGDDWDGFFSERAAVDKYTNHTKAKSRLRKLVGRIFGRH